MTTEAHPVEHGGEPGILLSMGMDEEMAPIGGEDGLPDRREEGKVLVAVLVRVVRNDGRKLKGEDERG